MNRGNIFITKLDEAWEGNAIEMLQELYDIYKRNFPFIMRAKQIVLWILSNEQNIIIEQRDEQNKLIGVSVINQNTVLLFCVDAEHRNKRIGTKLLTQSENAVKENGFDKIVLGNGFDYIMPGVPTAKRYCAAENEELCRDVNEEADNFFTKRGYAHSWECNCFDMSLSLSRFENDSHHVGDTIDDIMYRWAERDDMEGIFDCTEDAYSEFTVFFQDENLYAANNDTRVLVAVCHDEIVGALIVGTQEDDRRFGAPACAVVKRAWQGKHIAVNLLTIATEYYKEIGVEEVCLGYTYTGCDHVYGYAGYKISVYYMMAEKVM